MITTITFKQKHRGLFKVGDVIDLRPLTFLVGDNGSGKTTLLNLIASRAKNNSSAVISINDDAFTGIDGYVRMDMEKDNPRKQSENAFTLFGAMSTFRSHGETNMDIFVHDMSKFRNMLVILDEPDQALSIRSIYRLFSILQSIIENGCQVIAAIHSQTMMELVDEVYSVEHKQWMIPDKFLQTQKRSKKLKTVDSFKGNIRYRIKFITSNGDPVYYTGDASGLRRHAKEYKNSQVATRVAERELAKWNNKYNNLNKLEQHISYSILSYEIEQVEYMLGRE